MRTTIILAFSLIHLSTNSCKKEQLNSYENANTFVKVFNTEERYFSKNVLELEDGSIFLTALEAKGYGNVPLFENARIAKYSPKGDFLWQKELPSTIANLWAAKVLSNNNILMAGLDKESNTWSFSHTLQILIMNPEGEIIHSKVLPYVYNYTGIGSTSMEAIDVAEMPDGNIALVHPTINFNQSQTVKIRLVLFSPELGSAVAKILEPDGIIANKDIMQPKINFDLNGEILINGFTNLTSSSNGAQYLENRSLITKINGSDYTPVKQTIYNQVPNHSPSNFTFTNSNDIVWISGVHENTGSSHMRYFNLNDQERFISARQLQVWKINNENFSAERSIIDGFPKYGFINTLKRTQDGGYIGIGTCNINEDQLVPSQYRILIIKLNPDLSKQWTKVLNTDNSGQGVDITETNDGFLIAANYLSMDLNPKPVLIKVDKSGNL
ncbi:MAG: hypothetical protein N4A46_16330 [Schleiferiaceae bacterium]|jgi:hypothetical protein|nr:hypothetical protein [Schleiferiaceae bacterium]